MARQQLLNPPKSDGQVAGRIRPATQAWHNRLPLWIQADAGYQKLRQGPRQTLQVIANRCDALGDGGLATLLVCFGGEGLAEACGCDWRTLRRHLAQLRSLGFIIELSHGGGRLASVYGIPGCRGELDDFECNGKRLGTGPGGRWDKRNTVAMRDKLLVGQNGTLAEREVGQNDTPARTKCPTSPGILTPQVGQNVTLPSPIPSSSTSALNTSQSKSRPKSEKTKKTNFSFDDDRNKTGPEHKATARGATKALRAAGISPLARDAIMERRSPQDVIDLVQRCEGKATTNMAGYILQTFRQDIATNQYNAAAGRRETQADAIESESQRRIDEADEYGRKAKVVNAIAPERRAKLWRLIVAEANETTRSMLATMDATGDLDPERDRTVIERIFERLDTEPA